MTRLSPSRAGDKAARLPICDDARAYNGEPQDFDYVVGCNVKLTTYKDNSRTSEIGVFPQVFGRRMSDGKALVVVSPRACRGETTVNGQVQPDLLPIIAVYDDADNLAFGSAYMSEDAYESPRSVLEFGGASIERADQAAFEESRRMQHNLITHEVYWRAMRAGQATEPVLKWVSICSGYMRFRVPDAVRAMVREHWPASKPRFWEPADRSVLPYLVDAIKDTKQLQTDRTDSEPLPWRQRLLAISHYPSRGAATRRGGGRVSSEAGYFFPPSFYPDADGWGVPPWPQDPFADAARIFRGNIRLSTNVDMREGTRGFSYCYANLEVYLRLLAQPDANYSVLPISHHADGESIGANDKTLSPLSQFFERDEFLFYRFNIGLSTLFGGV